MTRLLLAIVIEIFVGVSAAGVILALLIPALPGDVDGHRWEVVAAVAGVLIVSVGVALFRPGSALRRYARR